MDKFQAALKKTLASAQDKAAANPSSTKAMTLGMQRRREEMEAKKKKEEMKKKEDEDRKMNQNKMKNIVQSALQSKIKDDKEERERKMKENKADMKKKE